MKNHRQTNSVRSLAIKESLLCNNRWIVADIPRKFMRPYHLMSKMTMEEKLREQRLLRKKQKQELKSKSTESKRIESSQSMSNNPNDRQNIRISVQEMSPTLLDLDSSLKNQSFKFSKDAVSHRPSFQNRPNLSVERQTELEAADQQTNNSKSDSKIMTKKERQDLLSRILAEPNPRKARLSAANIAKKSPDLSRKHSSSSAESKKNEAKLNALLDGFKEKKSHNPPEKKVKAHNILDDYLILLSHLHQTNRFTQFFDPLRLRMYLIQPSQEIIESRIEVAENSENYYLKGCKAYAAADFAVAQAFFKKVEEKSDPFYYESQFNLASSKFKCGDYQGAITIFKQLTREIKQQQHSFKGRDRRLFFNKALCELQMGKYEECLWTCNAYLRPLKLLEKKHKEMLLQEDKASNDSKRVRPRSNSGNRQNRKDQSLNLSEKSPQLFKEVQDGSSTTRSGLAKQNTMKSYQQQIYDLTQFSKTHCHSKVDDLAKLLPTKLKVRTSILKHFNLHPLYDDYDNENFVKELYRLKGFAHLRKCNPVLQDDQSQQKVSSTTIDKQAQHSSVVKAATCFQKAIGNDSAAIQKLISRIKKKRQRKLQALDDMSELKKLRATFINFRRKLEGQLVETDILEEISDINESVMSMTSCHSSYSKMSKNSKASSMSKVSKVKSSNSNASKLSKIMRRKLQQRRRLNAKNYEDLEDAIIGGEEQNEKYWMKKGRTTKVEAVKQKFKDMINNLNQAEEVVSQSTTLAVPQKKVFLRRSSMSTKNKQDIQNVQSFSGKIKQNNADISSSEQISEAENKDTLKDLDHKSADFQKSKRKQNLQLGPIKMMKFSTHWPAISQTVVNKNSSSKIPEGFSQTISQINDNFLAGVMSSIDNSSPSIITNKQGNFLSGVKGSINDSQPSTLNNKQNVNRQNTHITSPQGKANSIGTDKSLRKAFTSFGQLTQNFQQTKKTVQIESIEEVVDSKVQDQSTNSQVQTSEFTSHQSSNKEIEKHRKFLEQFEQEGKRLAKEIRQKPTRHNSNMFKSSLLFETQKTMQPQHFGTRVVIKQGPVKSETLKTIQMYTQSIKHADKSLRASPQEQTRKEQKPYHKKPSESKIAEVSKFQNEAKIITHSQSQRVMQNTLSKEEPFSTSKLRQELKKKQSFNQTQRPSINRNQKNDTSEEPISEPKKHEEPTHLEVRNQLKRMSSDSHIQRIVQSTEDGPIESGKDLAFFQKRHAEKASNLFGINQNFSVNQQKTNNSSKPPSTGSNIRHEKKQQTFENYLNGTTYSMTKAQKNIKSARQPDYNLLPSRHASEGGESEVQIKLQILKRDSDCYDRSSLVSVNPYLPSSDELTPFHAPYVPDYFALPKNVMTDRQNIYQKRSPAPGKGMLIKSMSVDKIENSEAKMKISQLTQKEEIEDLNQQKRVLNEVERTIRRPHHNLLRGDVANNTSNREDYLQAKKRIVEDFIYDQTIQDVVLEELNNEQKNIQEKPHTLNSILEAQKEITQIQIEESHFEEKSEVGNAYYGGVVQGSKISESIIRRLNREQLLATLGGDTQYCGRLRFFMQYPPKMRQKLLSIAELEVEQWNKAEKVVFKQGGISDYYYVIVKGTIQIEQAPQRFSKFEMPPIVLRTCYDGDMFGELYYFSKNTEEVINNGDKSNHKKQIALTRLQTFAENDFQPIQTDATDENQEQQAFDNDRLTRNLTSDEVYKLNEHKTTATTMEPCILLKLSKVESLKIINQTLMSNKFNEIVNFLWKIDLFKGINRNHLLPLISNIIIKKYRKGQYIQKEGEEPEGLKIIRKGDCVVCSDKLSMRRIDPKHLINKDNDFNEREADEFWYSNPNEMRNLNKHRVYQNKIELIDDNNKKIRKDIMIYKDLLPFENLYKGRYFGGRALLAITALKNVRKQIQRQENLIGNAGVSEVLKRSLLTKVKSSIFESEQELSKNSKDPAKIEVDIIDEQLEINKQLLQEVTVDITSLLSVVANSASVEIWEIDDDILSLLPYAIKQLVLNRLQAKQKVKIHKPKRTQLDLHNENVLKKLEQKEKEEKLQVTSQFKYNVAGNLVRSRMKGERNLRDNAKYIEELERVLKQDSDKFPKNVVVFEGSYEKRFNKSQHVQVMPLKQVNQPFDGNIFWCNCNVCKIGKKMPQVTMQDPTLMNNVVDIEEMQRSKNELLMRIEEFRKKQQQFQGGFDKVMLDEMSNGLTQIDRQLLNDPIARIVMQEEVREEYGEPDRPFPAQMVQELKRKFVDHDTKKMKTLQALRRQAKPKKKQLLQ